MSQIVEVESKQQTSSLILLCLWMMILYNKTGNVEIECTGLCSDLFMIQSIMLCIFNINDDPFSIIPFKG